MVDFLPEELKENRMNTDLFCSAIEFSSPIGRQQFFDDEVEFVFRHLGDDRVFPNQELHEGDIFIAPLELRSLFKLRIDLRDFTFSHIVIPRAGTIMVKVHVEKPVAKFEAGAEKMCFTVGERIHRGTM